MKTIIFPITRASEYREMMATLIGSNSQEGFTIDEVRTGIKVLDKLSVGNGDVSLEDSEYDFARARVLTARWKIASKEIIEFVDCVMNPSMSEEVRT